jgi:hypothetical protein
MKSFSQLKLMDFVSPQLETALRRNQSKKLAPLPVRITPKEQWRMWPGWFDGTMDQAA